MRADLSGLETLVTDRLDKKHIIITDSVKCAGHYPFILVLAQDIRSDQALV